MERKVSKEHKNKAEELVLTYYLPEINYLNIIFKDPRIQDEFVIKYREVADEIVQMVKEGKPDPSLERNLDKNILFQFITNFLAEHFEDLDQEAYMFLALKELIENKAKSKEDSLRIELLKMKLQNSKFEYFMPVRDEKQGEFRLSLVRGTVADLIGTDKTEEDRKGDLTKWERAIGNKKGEEKLNPIMFFLAMPMDEYLDQFCTNIYLINAIKRISSFNFLNTFVNEKKEEHLSEMKNFLVQVTDLANKNDQTKTTSLMETLMQANDSFEEDVLANTDSLMKFILTASDSEITEKVNEQIQRINRTEKEDRMNYLYRVIPEAVENFSYDFDMDKLFLLSAYRAAKILEEAGPTEELNKIITLIFNRSIQVIKNGTTVTLKEKDEKGNPKQITRKEIEKLRSNITQDGYYVSEKEKDRIRKEIFYRRENTSKFKGTRCRKGEST